MPSGSSASMPSLAPTSGTTGPWSSMSSKTCRCSSSTGSWFRASTKGHSQQLDDVLQHCQ